MQEGVECEVGMGQEGVQVRHTVCKRSDYQIDISVSSSIGDKAEGVHPPSMHAMGPSNKQQMERS